MSSRQFEILFACLMGVLWSACAARAQEFVRQPTRAQRAEPAPLRQGGFIQQLRAIPPPPAEILQEADERAFRLPARSHTQQPVSGTRPTADRPHGQESSVAPANQHADLHATQGSSIQRLTQREMSQSASAVAAQQLPPTYSELQNRSALSRRLRGEQGRLPVAAATQHAGVGLSLSDRSAVVDAEAVGSYPSNDPYAESYMADPYIVTASNESEPMTMAAEARPRQPSYQLAESKQRADEPRNEAFDALTAESLQRAPRVSRVPLPRSAAVANRSQNTVDAPPERIMATPVSVTPHLGGTRASNATMRSAISDSRVIPEVSPHATSLPSTGASMLQEFADERSTELELPALPSAAPSSNAAIDSQMAESKLPSLPVFDDNNDDSPAMAEMPMPSFGVVKPEVSLSETPKATQPPEHTSHSLNNAALARVRTQSADAPDQRLKMEAPRLSVVLNGPSDLPIGTPADYQIVVRNQDSFDLNGLILRLDIPAGVQVQTLKPTHGQFELESAADGLTMVTWSFEHLAAGQTATAPMQLVAGSAKNFAVAMEWTLMPMAGSSSISVRAPQLELALEGPAEVRFGEPNVYRLHIRNPGNAPAEKIAVRLSAERFGSSAAEIELIAPGEEEVIDVELTFNERGSIKIDAVAQEHTGLASQTAIAVVVRQAIVEAQLLTTPLVYHSVPTECRVRLSNQGDADARGMQAVLQLPEGAGLVSAPTGAVLKDRELTWPVDKLIAGSSEEFVVQLKLTAPGSNSLSLQCNGPGNITSTAQAVTHVESITDLKLFVEAPIAPAPVGGEVAYELTLTNRGSKAATNVIVVAQFSDGIEPIRSEGQPARVVPGQALFETLPRLAAGETVNLKVIAKAAAAGSHRFRVEVRSDDSEVRLVQEESTQYLDSARRTAAPPTTGSTLR